MHTWSRCARNRDVNQVVDFVIQLPHPCKPDGVDRRRWWWSREVFMSASPAPLSAPPPSAEVVLEALRRLAPGPTSWAVVADSVGAAVAFTAVDPRGVVGFDEASNTPFFVSTPPDLLIVAFEVDELEIRAAISVDAVPDHVEVPGDVLHSLGSCRLQAAVSHRAARRAVNAWLAATAGRPDVTLVEHLGSRRSNRVDMGSRMRATGQAFDLLASDPARAASTLEAITVVRDWAQSRFGTGLA
jgi:hypothetical protein